MGFSGNKPQGKTVPNSYLVVLNPKLSEEEVTTHINSIKSGEGQGHAELPNNSFQTFAFPKKDDVGAARSAATAFPSFRGYIGTFSPSTAEKIKESSQVDYVEQNQYYQVQNRVVQPDPPSWGLSRVSHRGPYTTGNHDYVYDDDESGKGVTAYVVDTGVKNDHQDFGGRVRWGMTVDTRADTYGHGTHVAGTIAGTKHGVAKEASIVAVKVFPDNSGTTETSTIIQGLEWAAGDALLNGNTDKCVVNLSLGGPRSQAMNDMIQAIVQVGMKVVVAAGNDSQDALHVSPASSRHAITVGAIDKSDAITWWSNWGRALDFNAPGENIISCGIDSPIATAELSGTSMASPHIAGLACCLLQKPEYRPFQSLAYELRLRAEGGCKAYPGNELGTPNLAAVGLKFDDPHDH